MTDREIADVMRLYARAKAVYNGAHTSNPDPDASPACPACFEFRESERAVDAMLARLAGDSRAEDSR